MKKDEKFAELFESFAKAGFDAKTTQKMIEGSSAKAIKMALALAAEHIVDLPTDPTGIDYKLAVARGTQTFVEALAIYVAVVGAGQPADHQDAMVDESVALFRGIVGDWRQKTAVESKPTLPVMMGLALREVTAERMRRAGAA